MHEKECNLFSAGKQGQTEKSDLVLVQICWANCCFVRSVLIYDHIECPQSSFDRYTISNQID